MKLLCDDYNEVYVWVDDRDENLELSPHFDYEADAVEWRRRMQKELKDENKGTNHNQHVLHHETRLWIEP
jgi:hypothetical protein